MIALLKVKPLIMCGLTILASDVLRLFGALDGALIIGMGIIICLIGTVVVCCALGLASK